MNDNLLVQARPPQVITKRFSALHIGCRLVLRELLFDDISQIRQLPKRTIMFLRDESALRGA
jgi:hypothetical protein